MGRDKPPRTQTPAFYQHLCEKNPKGEIVLDLTEENFCTRQKEFMGKLSQANLRASVELWKDFAQSNTR